MDNPRRFLRLPAAFPFFIFLFAPLPALSLQTPASGSCYVFPSPATGVSAWAVYEMPHAGTASVRIYNEAGDLVADVEDSPPAGVAQTPIDLSHFRDGLYLCRVLLHFSGGGAQVLETFKFVVTR